PEAAEQDPLRRPSLVGGQDLRQTGQLAHPRLEAKPRPAAGVGLVAALERGPLAVRHRSGAGIGKQVDQHVLGADFEKIPARPIQNPRPFLTAGDPNRLYTLDAERLEKNSRRRHLNPPGDVLTPIPVCAEGLGGPHWDEGPNLSPKWTLSR